MRRKTKILLIIILALIIGLLILLKKTDLPFVGINSTSKDIWSIGIYQLNNDHGILKALPYPGVNNPVLTAQNVTDIKAKFVADPFLVKEGEYYYMFFEVMGEEHGDIGVAKSKDALVWEYQKIVLDEPFHLSFPCVFKWGENYYMVPESSKDKSIRLYIAEGFPYKWRLIKKLIDGKEFADPVMFNYQDKWWLFATSKDASLLLFYSDNLEGKWTEHPQSPLIVKDANKARMAGNILFDQGRLLRIAQDDFPDYGMSVRAFEITKLTTKEYAERELRGSPLFKASGQGWNHDGMHQLSTYPLNDKEFLACVDGKKGRYYYIYVEISPTIFNFYRRLVK